jgi:hypothetical protein
MTPRYPVEDGVPRDWRGIEIQVGFCVVYSQLHNEGAHAEAMVIDNEDPEHRGRIRIEIIRRSTSNASYTRVCSKVWVHHSRLTVYRALPVSPYPFEEDLKPVGERLAAQRRRAMSGRAR